MAAPWCQWKVSSPTSRNTGWHHLKCAGEVKIVSLLFPFLKHLKLDPNKSNWRGEKKGCRRVLSISTKDVLRCGSGPASVWEAGPYIISHRDKQDTPSDQNSHSSLTALTSPYGENNTFNTPTGILLSLKLMRKQPNKARYNHVRVLGEVT